jgi:hypothetical protein
MAKKNSSTSNKKTKKPWPTKKAMEQVYAINLWGGEEGEFYSGDGSHNPDIVDPYIEVVTSFLQSFEHPLSLCDLGSGDFNVGRQLLPYASHYHAVDIVEALIKHNKTLFKADHLEFHCLDIAKDELPKADCAMLRQVLQHLSNAEISRVVNKLPTYQYVIVTEHLPEGKFEANTDIISGQGTRVKKGSGVELTQPPFNLKPKSMQTMLTIKPNAGKGIIVTTMYQMF